MWTWLLGRSPSSSPRGPETLVLCVKLISAKQREPNCSPDVPDLRPVLQEPAVGRLVLPARVARVFPEQLHLVRGVPRVPQGIAQILARAGFRLHCLTRSTDGSNVWIKDRASAAAGPQRHSKEKGKNPLPKALFSVTFLPSAEFQVLLLPGRGSPASTSVPSASTSPRRSWNCPGSRK